MHIACSLSYTTADRAAGVGVVPQRYCLRRLTRGLASGRKGARQGFASTLTAVLALRPGQGSSSKLSKAGKKAAKQQGQSPDVVGHLVPGAAAVALLEACLPVSRSMTSAVGGGSVVGQGG